MLEATIDGKITRDLKVSGNWLLISHVNGQTAGVILGGEEAIRCDEVTAYTAALHGGDPKVKVYLRGRSEAFDILLPEPIFFQFKKAVHGE